MMVCAGSISYFRRFLLPVSTGESDYFYKVYTDINMATHTRICLWSSPRNISTALMYAFAQRSDTTVVDEPLYGYYLAQSGAQHPGREEIMQSMDCDGQSVVDNILMGTYAKPILFFKHMTHHMVGRLSAHFMQHMINVFFIRDPKYILRSYAKVISTPTLADIGLDKQLDYVLFAREHGYRYIILDAGDILLDPEKALQQLCTALAIPFDMRMLSWTPGAIKEDGIWAKYWYDQVHRSSGFERRETEEVHLSPALEKVYLEALPVYQTLRNMK